MKTDIEITRLKLFEAEMSKYSALPTRDRAGSDNLNSGPSGMSDLTNKIFEMANKARVITNIRSSLRPSGKRPTWIY